MNELKMHIRDATTLKFVSNSAVTQGIEIYKGKNSTHAYVLKNGDSVEVHTDGTEFRLEGDASKMFYGCKSLTSLDLSSFDTQSLKNKDHMFTNCKALTTIDFGQRFW